MVFGKWSGRDCVRSVGALASGVVAALAGSAWGGGSGENVVIVVDPLNAESMYVANYYREIRGVPEANVLCFAPGADDYRAFASWNLGVLASMIEERGIAGQADYILLVPGAPFYIDAPDLVSDGCSPVRRFSISGAYTTAFIADEVLAGVPSSLSNRYSRNTFSMQRFDSETAYFNGSPSDDPRARRYYIGAMLGYTGERGNTLTEVLDSVDRSVAADFSRPGGTFYFMKTNDDARSSPRHNSYPGVVSELTSRGAGAVMEERWLPQNRFDCLSVLTGMASPDVDGGNFTILPGAYADHLTSWGAMFDNASQTKISAWIRKGAAMSHGTVEEPCNYPGKFTHARSMVYCYQGASLGESVFRALGFVPFQGLVYGDPLCRPFDYEVVVSVDDAPDGPVSGEVELTPSGTTDKPGNFVFDYDVLVDNRRVASDFRLPLRFDTRALADGWHEVRVVGYDSSTVRSSGAWVGELVVGNLGRAASVEAAGPLAGDLSTRFTFEVSGLTTGEGAPVEVRLVHHGRVLGAAAGCAGRVSVAGLQLGAGVSRVQAEALYADGMRVRSAPVEVAVDYEAGSPGGSAPESFVSTVWVGGAERHAFSLPHAFDDRDDALAFTIVEGPAQAGVVPGPAGPVVLIEPDAGASGHDVLTYRVSAGAGQSALGRVVLVYDRHPYDVNADGVFDIEDLYAIHSTPADVNFDGAADDADVRLLERLVRCGER